VISVGIPNYNKSNNKAKTKSKSKSKEKIQIKSIVVKNNESYQSLD